MKEMCNQFVSEYNASSCPVCGKATTPVMENGDTEMPVQPLQLAQAYVMSQPYSSPMEPEQSLACGTAFSDLVMPYCQGWHLYRFAKEV